MRYLRRQIETRSEPLYLRLRERLSNDMIEQVMGLPSWSASFWAW